MRFSKSHVVLASVLLASTFTWAQQYQTVGPTSLLARMSFTSSWMPQGFPRSSPQICFSVDRSGNYEMQRVTQKVSTETLHGLPDSKEDAKRIFRGPQTEVVQGTLSPDELKTLVTLLQDREFRTLSRSTGGIVLKGAETFVDVVPRASGVQRVVASDRDRESPLPQSVQGIVSWLWQFKPEGATPIDASAQDICPHGAVEPVNPSSASLRPTS
jgi:hypothetical protein